VLNDVDRPEDIATWQSVRADSEKRKQCPRISVIIPALDEAGYIGATLRAVKSACDVEVIVADGGSTDATTAIAASLGAEVLSCESGRARQANAAASHARGEILLFLHADTRLPAGWDRLIEEALASPGNIAGAFTFATDADGIWMRFFTWVANFRSRRLHRPYGDQGLFLRMMIFEKLGGFPEIPIMDDFEMVRRLARLGRIVIVPVPAITAGRRWRKLGVWRTMLRNQLCVIGYMMGVSPLTVARWYNRDQGMP
jgi:rSAM/selenodomain-associated transferase 2